jgi:hypothetical protein
LWLGEEKEASGIEVFFWINIVEQLFFLIPTLFTPCKKLNY